MFNKIKKNYSKLIASVVIAGISLANVGVVNAASLQDVHLSSDYAKEAIIELAEKNIITGDENGNFNPQNTVSRAEIITLIVKALEVDTTNVPDTPTFQDVPKTHWAYKYVEAAYREGIIKGMSEEIFGENELCTREQMTVMFTRSLGISDKIVDENEEFIYINELSDKDMISSWAKDSVEFSLISGLMKGTSTDTFTPKGSAQRQQVAVVTHRLISNKDDILDLVKDDPETVNHPELFEAFAASEEYHGEFSMNTLMNLSGEAPEDTMAFAITANGVVNGADSHTNLTMSISQPGLTFPDLTIEMINVNDKVYIKEPGVDTWSEATPEDLEGSTPNEINYMNEQFLNVYNDLNIENTGTVEIDGVSATKYTLSLDSNDIQELFPEDFLEADMGIDSAFNNDQFEFEIEFYLNDQNQIIKETVTFNGEIEEEGEVITFDLLMDVSFTNIGAIIEITPPSIGI